MLQPLRRAGHRGEGKWEEISWGEALDRLARAIQRGPGRAVVDLGRPDPLAGNLLARLGVTRLVEHHSSREWAAREAAAGRASLVWGGGQTRRTACRLDGA